MNLLLVAANEVNVDGVVTIRDSTRLAALLHLNVKTGTRIKSGIINGMVGTGLIRKVSDQEIELCLQLTDQPPPASPIELLIALPRPKMLRRILRIVGEWGIKKIWLLNSYRVEKSYWQSPLLESEAMQPYLLQGLQQAGDSMLPEIVLERRFRPFVEDRLATVGTGRLRLLAHPRAERACPRAVNEPCSLVLGPEGGFTDFEVDLMQQADFDAVNVGSRVLRVETALPVLLGRLSQ